MSIRKFMFFALISCFFSNAIAHTISDSTWITLDDKTGKPRAEVQLENHDGVVSGRILSVHRQTNDKGICVKCPGQFKNQPIEGITFLWGMKQEGLHNWSGGKILDPKTGKIYHAKMLLKGNKLYVRGYIGVSMIGRTQIWERKSAS